MGLSKNLGGSPFRLLLHFYVTIFQILPPSPLSVCIYGCKLKKHVGLFGHLKVPVACLPRATESACNTGAVRDVADEVVAGAEGHGVPIC
jgi:hypothetical protein